MAAFSAVSVRVGSKPFDYRAKADVFTSGSGLSRRKPLQYRSFEFASDAIRYLMEELPPERLGGVCLEIDELRFDADGIRNLYQSAAYPLDRLNTAKKARQ